MRTVIFTYLFLLSIVMSAQTFTKADYETYKEEGDYLNGKKTDIWKEYFKNNNLKSIGEYVPASPDKIVIIDPDKNLESVNVDTTNLKIELSKDISFKKGQWKYFFPDGTLQAIENYVPLHYCRPSATMDPNTYKPVISYTMPGAELHGKQMIFYHNGKLKQEAEYFYGTFKYEKFYDETGKLESEEKAESK